MITFRCWRIAETRLFIFYMHMLEFGYFLWYYSITLMIYVFSSIARTSQTTREQIRAYVNLLGNDPLPLTEQQEFRLARQILKFSDCILNILDNLQLHKLCDYVYNLATSFHDFYKDCYVVEKNAKTGLLLITRSNRCSAPGTDAGTVVQE